ncbi:MAG TPA: hypothetical protein VKZ53_16140 [Candidatus Angelobacter sp.]|nr:hypothetical protein [Candidatus Angelobacter sp.]
MRLKFLCTMIGSLLLATTTVWTQEVDLCNVFVPIPTNGGSCFTYVLQGDQRNNINIQETLADATLNPFKYRGIPSCAKVTYDASTNTTSVTICGTQPIVPGETFTYGSNSNGLPHFGLDSKGPINVVSSSWSNTSNACSAGSAGVSPQTGSPSASSVQSTAANHATQAATTPAPPVSLPMLSLAASQPVGINPARYTLFVAAQDFNGNVVGTWCQGVYKAGALPAMQIANFTNTPVTITNVGFILNDQPRPLNTLNFGQLSPPGIEGSPFAIPKPLLNGTVLQPGQSIPAPTQ